MYNNLKKKSLLASAIIEAADMVETDYDIARYVRGTKILVNASQVRLGLIEEIRANVVAMEQSDHRFIRKFHYKKLSGKLAKEYVALG